MAQEFSNIPNSTPETGSAGPNQNSPQNLHNPSKSPQNTPFSSPPPLINQQNGPHVHADILLDNQPIRLSPHRNPNVDIDDQTFFKEMRGSLMIVSILAAGSTYQAGLNPPGNFWQDNNGHTAGNPILHDTFFKRYQAFFYCNAVSFLSSLVIIIFLMNKNFYCDKRKIKVLEITMVLDLFSFMAAYAVGSCRHVSSSIYVFLIMGGVFVYVISFARHYSVLHNFASQMSCRVQRTVSVDTVRTHDNVLVNQA